MNWSNTPGVLRSLIGSWFGRLLLVCILVLAAGAKGQTDLVAEQIELLKSSDAAIRVNAAAALGKFKDPRGVEPLIGVLRDTTGEADGRLPWRWGS